MCLKNKPKLNPLTQKSPTRVQESDKYWLLNQEINVQSQNNIFLVTVIASMDKILFCCDNSWIYKACLLYKLKNWGKDFKRWLSFLSGILRRETELCFQFQGGCSWSLLRVCPTALNPHLLYQIVGFGQIKWWSVRAISDRLWETSQFTLSSVSEAV